MNNEVEVGLELLTDDAIADYSRSDGKDRVLFDHRDLNLRFDNVHPVPGGAYDTDIFGSPFADRCVCGKIRQASSEPCPNCGARVFTKEEGLRRFARIELPFYYLNELRLEIFQNFIDDVFKDSKIETEFIGDPKRNGFTAGRGSKFGMKVYDSCQFEYNPKNKTLYVKELIDDEEKCSYEGLMKIIKEHFPDRLTEYMKLINHYYLVQPAMMRPFTLAYKDGKRIMGSHKLTIWYCVIIRLCCVEDKKSNDLNYEEVMSKFKTPGERVRYTALLRAFLNTGKKEATELLNTSKKNLARDLYSVRTKNSARCPIAPSTTNAIDEITIPRHLAYEMCREGFIKYLMDNINFTYDEAKKLTKLEALNPETQKLFEEYAQQQVVLVNRQPSLHEYSIFAMKLRLTDENVIFFPLQVCGSLNADFDGDTVQIQLVPTEVREDTLQKMSPRYVNMYKKTNEPIFPFNHETLNLGLKF